MGGSAVAICDGCFLPYTPKRRPAAGRLHFCQNCGLTMAWRLAKRRQADKRRALHLFARGASMADIADQVEQPIEAVKRWLQPLRRVEPAQRQRHPSP